MFFVDILGNVMGFLYDIFNNYGLAIIVFTLFSKIILLPVSIIVQKNSIKMVKMQPEINRIKIDYFGDKDKIADEEAKLYKREKYNAFVSIIPLVVQIILLLGLVEVINNPERYIENLDVSFLGFDLTWVCTEKWGISILSPIIAGLSAFLMCIGQNKMNVLQAEQSKLNKYGMLILSVGLSLYLGAFVAAGVALYWTASNLFAILQQWLLNIFINPKKFVNYEELEKTRKELKELNDSDKKLKRSKEQIKKEKDDYKRFFGIVNKKLVFYSEGNGFYKYFKGIIEYLLENTNIVIHYITSDYNDNIFNLEKENSRIKAYYIDQKKIITLMMKMDADVVVMTMPDLETYHIKRSYVRKDIEYIYIPHGMDSLNLTMRTGSMNHFDTVFATGKYQREEAEKTNEVYGLKNRKIINWGYSVFDDMLKGYKESNIFDEKTILIAPSWQKDNIVDLCLYEILDSFRGTDYKVVVRPHPQQVRHQKEKFEAMKELHKNDENIFIQTDFSSNDTVFNSSLLITDWSAISYEYAFTTKRPVIYIDTPMKIMNPEYEKIGVEPFNIWSRNVTGRSVKIEEVKEIKRVADEMIENIDDYREKISKLVDDSVYNIGKSSEIGAKYIINTIQEKINLRKGEK